MLGGSEEPHGECCLFPKSCDPRACTASGRNYVLKKMLLKVITTAMTTEDIQKSGCGMWRSSQTTCNCGWQKTPTKTIRRNSKWSSSCSAISHTRNWPLKNGKAICIKKSQKNAPGQIIHVNTYKHIPHHFNINYLLVSWLLLKYRQLRQTLRR